MLEPVTAEIARAVVAGDLSAVRAAEGWPHDDTVDAMSMATEPDPGPMWLITLGGRIVGDCGTLGLPTLGEVEIGYGLAVSARGFGYATEAAGAVCTWLFTQADVTLIGAVGVLADNRASRGVLEKLGFTVTGESDQRVSYALTSDRLRYPP